MTGICFGDDRFIQPLQAADLLACTTVREMRRGQYAWNEPSPFRGLLQASSPVYGIIYETEYWDEQSINENRNALLSLWDVSILAVAGAVR